MKKCICMFILVLAAISAYGRDFSMSAGTGGLLGSFFTRYTLKADGINNGAQIKINADQEVNQLNYGFFVFFDATYGELGVFFQNGANTFKEPVDMASLGNTITGSGKGWDTVLGFSLSGKYPFWLNEKFIVYPLLGLDYQLSLNQQRTQPDGWIYDRNDGLREKDKDGNAYRLEDWNAFWINLGGGLDFLLTDNLFFRGELRYGFRLMTPYEVKNLEMMKKLSGDPKPKLGGLSSGPSIQLCAGYRFIN